MSFKRSGWRPKIGSYAAAFLWLAGCTYQPTRDPRRPPLLVATTTLSADALRHVAWPGAHIEALMGPGTDPHLFKPSLADVRLLAEADVIVAGGLHLEGKMSDVLHRLAEEKPILYLSDSVDPKRIRYAPNSTTAADPHIWFDVDMWRLGVKGLGGRLARLYPQHSSVILQKTEAYADTLAALDSWVRRQTANVPRQQRILVTSHDAFSYFGRAYGYEVKTLQGISTLSDFGLKDVSGLVSYLIAHNVRTLYPETSMPPQTLEAIQEASARAGHTVLLGSQLYTDALDAAGRPAGTYVGMIRFNIATITHATPNSR